MSLYSVYIMAGKSRFRIPTLEEMDKADNTETLSTVRPLFRRDAASNSKSTDDTSKPPDSVPTPTQSSPPKRMISQKALLSRQPLSSARIKKTLKTVKSSVSPKKNDPSPSCIDSAESESSCLGDVLGHHRVSRVTESNIGRANLKPSAGPLTADVGSSRKAATSETPRPDQGQDFHKTGNVAQRQSGQSATIQTAQSNQMTDSGTSHPDQTDAEQDSVRADVLPTLAKLGKTNSLVVSSRQRGNPILNYVRNVPWEYGNIVPDYVMGQGNCALYLSLRYHQLHPEYIHNRLKQLGHSFELRVLLVQVDIKDPHHMLKDLAKICILADCTLMLAFSAEEAGRYLETYKVYENKAAEAIMERTDSSFGVQLSDCLTRVKSVNKTDCSTLLATFGSLQGVMKASTEDMSLCPGFGPQKAKRLHDVFREPFLVSKKQRESGK